MSIWFERWVEEEYIRLAVLADQLLGKEKVVDFYYGDSWPEKEHADLFIPNLIPQLDDLLAKTQIHLRDDPPFYPKTIFSQQISGFKTYLENQVSSNQSKGQSDYAQSIKLLLGEKLRQPDWQSYQLQLKADLAEAGYLGSTKKMLKEWQYEGQFDVFSFMEISNKLLPGLWEAARAKLLGPLLSEEEIDFIQERSQVKFFHLNNIWEDWPYYGGYRGGYMTMIALNARLLWNRYEAKAFLAHEVVPGRHLFWSIRQRMYDTKQLPDIGMLSTFASPERLIQEGMIACAHEYLWPDGFSDIKEQIALDYWRLRRAVGLTAAIKLYQDKEHPNQVLRFIQKQAYLTPGKAKALLGIIQEQPYHYPTAQLGYELVKNFWRRHNKDFLVELTHYRCPALLRKLYPVPAGAEGEIKIV